MKNNSDYSEKLEKKLVQYFPSGSIFNIVKTRMINSQRHQHIVATWSIRKRIFAKDNPELYQRADKLLKLLSSYSIESIWVIATIELNQKHCAVIYDAINDKILWEF